MLDLVLRDIAFRARTGFALEGVSLTAPASAHTALTGPGGCGTTTLARLIAGDETPDAGEILIGQRVVNAIRRARRPLLFVDSRPDVSARWSVEHALVAAVRTRKLDRHDRRREHLLAVEKWELGAILQRRIGSLAATETARVQLARIDLMHPALLVADRVLERVSPAARVDLADALFRTLRVHGTTVVNVPSSHEELAFSDHVAILDGGTIVQTGSAAEVHQRPVSEGAARATGECDAVPITITGNQVASAIGSWTLDAAPFQGPGVAIVRPSHFAPAAKGEESDLIFGVEEAGLAGSRWRARGFVSGATTIRVELPAETGAGRPLHKGKLFPMRYDPRNFLLLPRAGETRRAFAATDIVPPLAETR